MATRDVRQSFANELNDELGIKDGESLADTLKSMHGQTVHLQGHNLEKTSRLTGRLGYIFGWDEPGFIAIPLKDYQRHAEEATLSLISSLTEACDAYGMGVSGAQQAIKKSEAGRQIRNRLLHDGPPMWALAAHAVAGTDQPSYVPLMKNMERLCSIPDWFSHDSSLISYSRQVADHMACESGGEGHGPGSPCDDQLLLDMGFINHTHFLVETASQAMYLARKTDNMYAYQAMRSLIDVVAAGNIPIGSYAPEPTAPLGRRLVFLVERPY